MRKFSCILAVAATVSSVSAFVLPTRASGGASSSFLNAINGEEVRDARGTYANHGTGEIGSFERAPPQGGAPIPTVMGEDVRHARPTYAAHGTGEIGSDQRKAFVPQSAGNLEEADHDGDWRT